MTIAALGPQKDHVNPSGGDGWFLRPHEFEVPDPLKDDDSLTLKEKAEAKIEADKYNATQRSPFDIWAEREATGGAEKKQLLSMLSYRKKVCREVLRVVFAQHTVDNAFFPLNMGPNPSGIFGVTPTNLMHAFEEGVVP